MKTGTGMHFSCIPVPFRLRCRQKEFRDEKPQHFRPKRVNITAVENYVENVQNPIVRRFLTGCGKIIFCLPFTFLIQNQTRTGGKRPQAPCTCRENALQYIGPVPA
jgi:hypothetical protein